MILLRSAHSSAIVRTPALLALTLLLSFHAFASDGDVADKLKVDYPITKVGVFNDEVRLQQDHSTWPCPHCSYPRHLRWLARGIKEELQREYDRMLPERVQRTMTMFELSVYSPTIEET
jgi:hypothetical protein